MEPNPRYVEIIVPANADEDDCLAAAERAYARRLVASAERWLAPLSPTAVVYDGQRPCAARCPQPEHNAS